MSPSERVTQALHRFEALVERLGRRGTDFSDFLSPLDLTVEKWEYDETTDTLSVGYYAEPSPFDVTDTPRFVQKRLVLEEVVRDRLTSEAKILLQALDGVASEDREKAAALSAWLHTRIEAIRKSWQQQPPKRQATEEVLKQLARKLRTLTEEASGSGSKGTLRSTRPRQLPQPTQQDSAAEDAVREAVAGTLAKELPRLVQQAVAKPWLTTREVMELTGWSKRTMQHLRDTRQIPFSQDGRKILYPAKEVEAFLKSRTIPSRRS